jgi:hypothetical protein
MPHAACTASPPLLSLAVALCLVAAACEDPVRERAVAALGSEAPGVRPGPLHRPGQPCGLCHDAAAGLGRPFSIAGTIYADDMGEVPVNESSVRMIDAAGAVFTATTNCAGNFFVRVSEYAPTFPVFVTVTADGQSVDMESPVYREISCATCHTDPKRRSSAGHVFVRADEDAPALAPNHFCR